MKFQEYIFDKSRSKIYVLFGITELGGFICMSNFRAGCHIVDLRNDCWNKEELIHILGKIDGITVATALKVLADKIDY